jgi:hypothetical protein
MLETALFSHDDLTISRHTLSALKCSNRQLLEAQQLGVIGVNYVCEEASGLAGG